VTALNRAWGNLTQPGQDPPAARADPARRWAPVLGAARAVRGSDRQPGHPERRNIDIVRFLVAATAILLFTVPAAFVIIFMEMKVIAR
jgi:hypothetical protein